MPAQEGSIWAARRCDAGLRTARKNGDLCVSVEIAFRFNLDGLQIKAAWWYADPEQIASFRAAAAAEESGRALHSLVSSLASDGYEVLGDVMKRIPRGCRADHPRAHLLKHRSLSVGRELDSDAVRDVAPVYRVCEELRPLLAYFAEHTAAQERLQFASSASDGSADRSENSG